MELIATAKQPSFIESLPGLSDQEFARWQSLLEERTGISFESHRKILQTGLVQRMREVGCKDYSEYYNTICFGKGGASEWAALLKTLTVKETRFWRDEDALTFLRKQLKQRFLQLAPQESINIWSAACSTGEEPYSIAMICDELVQELGLSPTQYGIIATDICLASLAFARKGIYPKRRLDVLNKELKDNYFEPSSSSSHVISNRLKDRVCFARTNLIDLENVPIDNMDIIYCQNVLIYFKPQRQKQVLDQLVKSLQPNGILIIGMGEALSWQNKQVKKIKNDRVQAFIKQA